MAQTRYLALRVLWREALPLLKVYLRLVDVENTIVAGRHLGDVVVRAKATVSILVETALFGEGVESELLLSSQKRQRTKTYLKLIYRFSALGRALKLM